MILSESVRPYRFCRAMPGVAGRRSGGRRHQVVQGQDRRLFPQDIQGGCRQLLVRTSPFYIILVQLQVMSTYKSPGIL